MPKGNRLVRQHLEGVSGTILQEYPDIVREQIKGKAGIYALYRKDGFETIRSPVNDSSSRFRS